MFINSLIFPLRTLRENGFVHATPLGSQRERSLLICCYVLAFVLVSCGSVGPPSASNNATANIQSTGDNMAESDQNLLFFKNLPRGFVKPKNDPERLLLKEYGAVYVARGGVTPPSKIVFKDEADVSGFQAGLAKSTENIGGVSVELQSAAMSALREARVEAQKSGLTIGPRGADSARRGYKQTVDLWASRVNPGFVHWVGLGKVTQAEANRIKALSPVEQVPEILTLEKSGIFFAKDLSKSVIYSVAPPGTSQHLSMLAFDAKEFENSSVRAILYKHGWYQTVVSDLPHFTYLGVSETELPGLGLKRVENAGRVFWVPDI